MLTNLIEELKEIAQAILEEGQTDDLESRLVQSRRLYEKLVVLNHLDKEKENSNPIADELPEEHRSLTREENLEEMQRSLTRDENFEEVQLDIKMEPDTIGAKEPEIVVEEPKEIAAKEPKEIVESTQEDKDAPLSLNDLFVPTFDGIKEDFSLKEEFKDTVSLDETENMFEVKKEAPRQLSLNDKLVGNSIQVGLNDRIAFVNKLFNFSQSDFNKVLSKLNQCGSQEEALKYFQYQVKPNYNWKGKEDLEERLISLVQRKFM